MNAKKLFFGLIGLTVALILATAGVFYFANSFLVKSSSKLNNLKVQNSVIEKNEQIYTKARNDLAKNKDLKQTVEDALPKEKDQAKAIKEIIQIGRNTGVKIEKIEFTDSTLGDKAKTTATTPSASSPSATPQAAPSATITQAKPIAGISGVQGIEMKVTLAGPNDKTPINYNGFVSFLDQVSNNRRSMQIAQLDIQPGLKKADLKINIFVKP
jgi:hypothetical protein